MKFLKLLIFSTVQIGLTVAFTTLALAQTITVEVSGNGENSTNSTNVTVAAETNVQSENFAQVANDVSSAANSGANTANNNTGDAQITTGDISQKVAIENDVNTNVISVDGCGGCSSNLEIKNSGNGADSQNTINTNISSQTDIQATNIANISNNVEGSSISGKNTANNNVGSVKIDTGDITIKINGGIVNSINKTLITVDPTTTQNIRIFNLENGANSVNGINVKISNIVNLEKIDIWQLENNVFWEAVTGENSCSYNVGDCQISTGDILLSFEIVNSGNFDFVFVGAPQLPPIGEPEPQIPPQPGVQPPQAPGPAQAGPPGPSGPAAPGEVLASLAQLPVTGPGSLVFLLLLWFSLLLTGVVLKRLGNRSPPALFYKIW